LATAANLRCLGAVIDPTAGKMTLDGRSAEGLAQLRHALSEYPRYFNHPNWESLPAPTP